MNMVTQGGVKTSVIASGKSALGAMAVAAADGKVTGIRFGYPNERQAAAALSRRDEVYSEQGDDDSSEQDEQLASDVLERLQRYADGEAVDFSDVPVALDHLSAFQRRVVKACRAIPAGQRRTYGELAAAAGSRGAARAVGQVMACNRVPLVVPCHRVVASGGGLGGFSAPQGLAMKRRLLALEEECSLFS
jgi:O-6-methylguanine DNA methyltransferase